MVLPHSADREDHTTLPRGLRPPSNPPTLHQIYRVGRSRVTQQVAKNPAPSGPGATGIPTEARSTPRCKQTCTHPCANRTSRGPVRTQSGRSARLSMATIDHKNFLIGKYCTSP